jgi:hypothetical protein
VPRWFREAIKDDALADEVARVEEQRIGPHRKPHGDRGALYWALRKERTNADKR